MFAKAPYTNERVPESLSGELLVGNDCASDVTEIAASLARDEILEVLTTLEGVDSIDQEQKKHAGLIMGQYLMDRICSEGLREEDLLYHLIGIGIDNINLGTPVHPSDLRGEI